jgi:hypothetical protein
MKRGGQIIYGGPLGQNSRLMIEYFQVTLFFNYHNLTLCLIIDVAIYFYKFDLNVTLLQSIDGVCPIKDGQNPATWMLEISTPYAEERIGKDFADIYLNSNLYG